MSKPASTSKLPQRLIATRFTQRNQREVKGSDVPGVKRPKPRHVCSGCAKPIRPERTHCATCAIDGATERLVNAARIGHVAARSPEARAKHVASRAMARPCSAWDASRQPAWLTSEVFAQQIQPLLASISTSAIRSPIGVSRWYAGRIREGYRPHPRHWEALAQLVGWRGMATRAARPSGCSISVASVEFKEASNTKLSICTPPDNADVCAASWTFKSSMSIASRA